MVGPGGGRAMGLVEPNRQVAQHPFVESTKGKLQHEYESGAAPPAPTAVSTLPATQRKKCQRGLVEGERLQRVRGTIGKA